MQQVPIQSLPNQQLSIVLDDNTWLITLKETDGQVSVSLSLNSAAILDNARATAGSFLIPSRYEEAGNFLFLTSDQALPDYAQFNVTQSLIYVSAAELSAIRTQPAPPISASYFNPIAALPLRFAPQGYSS